MFDVVTDFPTAADAATVVVPLGTVAGGRFVPHEDRPAPEDQVRLALARPGQMVSLGQGLAYLDRIAPLGSTGPWV